MRNADENRTSARHHWYRTRSTRPGLDQPADVAEERWHGVLLPLWYKHHLEAVYCVSGNGSILDKATGETHQISDGTLYALDKHDPHTLRGGTEDMRLICAFNPPVTGAEVHDEDGAYLPDTSED